MKIHTKKLIEKWDKTKKDNEYYTLDSYLKDCQRLLDMIDKRKTIYCHITPSVSGMSRRINFDSWVNCVLNIVYNNKMSWEEVKIGGCGMNMLWYLLFRFCETATTSKMIDKHGLNGKCSDVTRLL